MSAAMRIISSAALFLSFLGPSAAFQVPVVPVMARGASRADALSSMSSSDNYLSSMSSGSSEQMMELPRSSPIESTTQARTLQAEHVSTFSHAPLSQFSVDKLTPKGPRKNADVGQPHDASLPLVKVGPTSAGSWWCATGGWPSPALRPTTEVFYVLTGRGCLTDLDETKHYFGPGDTVVLPKGWSGRWDIFEDIHKMWVVHDHPDVEQYSNNVICAVVTPYCSFETQNLNHAGVRADAIHGSPSTSSGTIYDTDFLKVGCWTCTPGSFPVVNRATTECFHVLEGVFFLTNEDGSARRGGPGDTVVLPKGWTGTWDVIEPLKKVWVVTK